MTMRMYILLYLNNIFQSCSYMLIIRIQSKFRTYFQYVIYSIFPIYFLVTIISGLQSLMEFASCFFCFVLNINKMKINYGGKGRLQLIWFLHMLHSGLMISSSYIIVNFNFSFFQHDWFMCQIFNIFQCLIYVTDVVVAKPVSAVTLTVSGG